LGTPLFLIEAFVEACTKSGIAVALRMQEGYDHSYYFIATFIEEHLRHAAAALV
jgi:S-formylglutathione hydrolase